MNIMFDENFSFDAPIRSSSVDSTSNTISTREPSRSVSPCSPATGPFPPPRFSVTDLAATFASSRLRTDSQICYDSCETYANMDDDASWAIPPPEEGDCLRQSRPRAMPSRPHSPTRRKQRQLTTRLLCSVSHAKEVADLVTRMVECKDQCQILAVDPNSSTSDDEGYDSSDARSSDSNRISAAISRARLEFRRSSDIKSGACVSKAVRLRKRKDQRRIKSSESES